MGRPQAPSPSESQPETQGKPREREPLIEKRSQPSAVDRLLQAVLNKPRWALAQSRQGRAGIPGLAWPVPARRLLRHGATGRRHCHGAAHETGQDKNSKTQEQTDDNLPMLLIGVGSGKQLQPHNNLVGITGNQY